MTKLPEFPDSMPVNDQIRALADFLLEHYPSKIHGGAIETAMRVLAEPLLLLDEAQERVVASAKADMAAERAAARQSHIDFPDEPELQL